MTKTILAVTAVLATMGVATLAQADVAAANACAANLTPDGKQIYAAVMANNPTNVTLRDIMESQTRGLGQSGKISRGDARENAIAAAQCVQLSL
jgi:hypothetical protein